MSASPRAEPAASAALDRLYETVAARRGAAAASSYTASLLEKGAAHCARKLGEEAVELVIAAVEGDRKAATAESADLLYHWLVLMAALDLNPAAVYAELDGRAGTSGHVEKASRSGGAAG